LLGVSGGFIRKIAIMMRAKGSKRLLASAVEVLEDASMRSLL
jgi:hypothetical protein